MKLTVLLDQLKARGVAIEAAGDRLKLTAPTGVLADADRVQLRRSKPELLLLLQSDAASSPATGSTPDDVPPALLEYSERMFDERLRVWRRGDFIEPTRGTLPAYRASREYAALNVRQCGQRPKT